MERGLAMEDIYMKETNNIREKTEIEKEMELIQTIMKTSDELRIANTNFNFAQGELVDYYVYQIKANQSKLDYLIKVAKHKGISVDMIRKMEYDIIEAKNKAV